MHKSDRKSCYWFHVSIGVILFNASCGLSVLYIFNHSSVVFLVTAFPDRKIMSKYLCEISWETEVWIAEAPTHMIHFNGDRFLGPHD